MLQIKTKVGPSEISNLGLFAITDIPSGATIATLSHWDAVVDSSAVLAEEKDFFNRYFSLQGNTYQTYFDDMKFMNHSETPNCVDLADGRTITLMAVKTGDELTCNYCLICDLWKKN